MVIFRLAELTSKEDAMVSAPLTVSGTLVLVPPDPVIVKLLNVSLLACEIVCAEVPLKVTVAVPGTNVPWLFQFPPSVMLRLLAFKVPPVTVTLLTTVNGLVKSCAVEEGAFTTKFPTGATVLMRMVELAGVEEFPICSVPPVTE